MLKLALRTPEGRGLVPKFHGRHGGPDHTGRTGRTWILWTLELGAIVEAVELAMEGPPSCCRLRWPRENVCLEVNCRKMEAGNMIFLWNDDPPVPDGHHSTFVLNDDGSISPHKHCPGANAGNPQSLALGLRGSTCVLVRRDDPNRLLIERGAQLEEPPLVMGKVMMAEAVELEVPVVVKAEAGSSGANLPLIEMVNILKRELGVEGTIQSVVQQAAEQVGVDIGGKPLPQLAKECLAALGR